MRLHGRTDAWQPSLPTLLARDPGAEPGQQLEQPRAPHARARPKPETTTTTTRYGNASALDTTPLLHRCLQRRHRGEPSRPIDEQGPTQHEDRDSQSQPCESQRDPCEEQHNGEEHGRVDVLIGVLGRALPPRRTAGLRAARGAFAFSALASLYCGSSSGLASVFVDSRLLCTVGIGRHSALRRLRFPGRVRVRPATRGGDATTRGW